MILVDNPNQKINKKAQQLLSFFIYSLLLNLYLAQYFTLNLKRMIYKLLNGNIQAVLNY